MRPVTEQAIRDHARREFPRECCGVIIQVGNKDRYVPCRNVAESPFEHFMLSPEDYSNAEDAGTVVGIVHSHPNGTAKPSQADLSACEASEMPWWILQLDAHTTGELRKVEPSGWEAPLTGRHFVFGVHDCFSLVRDYYQREHGLLIPDIPDRRDNFWKRGENLYMQHYEACGFAPIVGPMKVGDAVAMQIRSAPKIPNHFGVITKGNLLLHHLPGRLSCRDVYDGYFRSNTFAVLRHRDMT